MWHTLMDWLPDFRVGTFEVRDIANLVIASVALYLAFLATKLSLYQTKTALVQFQIQDILLAQNAKIDLSLGSYSSFKSRQRNTLVVTNKTPAPVHAIGWLMDMPAGDYSVAAQPLEEEVDRQTIQVKEEVKGEKRTIRVRGYGEFTIPALGTLHFAEFDIKLGKDFAGNELCGEWHLFSQHHVFHSKKPMPLAWKGDSRNPVLEASSANSNTTDAQDSVPLEVE